MNKKIILFLFISIFVISSCDDDYVPKPIGLFRIDIPEHDYIPSDSSLDYSFLYASTAKIISKGPEHPQWINLSYPKFKASIFISYHDIDSNLASFVNDCHTLAYKHASVATDIQIQRLLFPEQNTYGIVYNIKGNKVASPLNFYLTDSVNHFLRGALYFNLPPNNDSLAPVILSIEKDMDVFFKSFQWKN